MKITYDLSNIDSVAAQIIAQAKSNMLLFYGDMGVGKTTLIKALAKQLGIEEAATSPTFSIVNEYRTPKQEVIYHFDFYRIEQPEEVLDFGFEEYLEQGDWIFIEWPEKLGHFIPENGQKVQVSLNTQEKRDVELI